MTTQDPARRLFFPRVLGAVAVLSAGLSAVGFAVISPPAQSTPENLSKFNSRYDTRGSRLDTCATCHTSATPAGDPQFNPYGADYNKHKGDFAAIEGLDSDGDGFSNIDEIKAETFPGDPNENPANPPTTTTTSTTTTTTTRPFPFSMLPEAVPQPGR